MARQRLTVQQASEVLGVSTDAVRKRARRGTLEAEKAEDGSLYVWLGQGDAGAPNGTPPGAPNGLTPTQAHLDSLQDQIEFLRAELERKDHLLLGLISRVPELEASERPSEARQGDAAGAGGVADHPDDNGAQRRSWLYRFFFGA